VPSSMSVNSSTAVDYVRMLDAAEMGATGACYVAIPQALLPTPAVVDLLRVMLTTRR
jgi:hypothetical protein